MLLADQFRPGPASGTRATALSILYSFEVQTLLFTRVISGREKGETSGLEQNHTPKAVNLTRGSTGLFK